MSESAKFEKNETFRTSPAARGGSQTQETQQDIQSLRLTLRAFG